MSVARLVSGIVVLCGITLAAYIPAYRAGFIWDDDDYILNNQTLRSPGGLPAMWLVPGAIPQYYPMTHTTFWFEWQLFRDRATGYHVTNVMLHAANAVLVWLVLRRLRLPGAWFVAAVFAVHPVCVESVAWITERKNVLSGLFYLLALHAYLSFRPATTTQPTGDRWGLYWLSLALFAAALLSKTVACSLPAAILLILWWQRGRLTLRDVKPLLPFFAVGLALAGFTAWMERTHVGALGPEWDLSPLDRVLIAGRAVWFYASKLLWPAQLAFIYERWAIDSRAVWQYVFPAAALALLVLLWLLRRRIGRGPLVAALFFGGTLVPALGFFNIYPMRYAFVADHFQYFASLGVLALVVGAVARSAQRLGTPGRGVAAAAAVLVLAVLGWRTWQQTHIYATPETLWRDTLTQTPTATIAWNNLGEYLIRHDQAHEAIPYFEQAVLLRPDDPRYRNSLAAALLHSGRRQDALRTYHEALTLAPDDLLTHRNLGAAYGEDGDYTRAIKHLRRVLEIAAVYREERRTLRRTEGVALLGALRMLPSVLHDQCRTLEQHGDRVTAAEVLRTTLPLLDQMLEYMRPQIAPDMWYALRQTVSELQQQHERLRFRGG